MGSVGKRPVANVNSQKNLAFLEDIYHVASRTTNCRLIVLQIFVNFTPTLFMLGSCLPVLRRSLEVAYQYCTAVWTSPTNIAVKIHKNSTTVVNFPQKLSTRAILGITQHIDEFRRFRRQILCCDRKKLTLFHKFTTPNTTTTCRIVTYSERRVAFLNNKGEHL